MKHEQGFSMIKMMIIGAVLAAGVMGGAAIFPVYSAYWKIQDTFEGVAKSMTNKTETEIRKRLPDLFNIKYLKAEDIPEEFYNNLMIRASGSSVKISSSYHVTVWLMGEVEAVDANSEYEESDLKGMDKIRHKLRRDFDFEPYAETP